jgi:hypothetical protein
MEFRWVIFLALWTMLSGPVFARLAVPADDPGAAVAPQAPISVLGR